MAEPTDPCVEISLIAARVDAMGCTDDEIARVSSDQGRPLPRAYCCFLKSLGRDLGGLFDGAVVSYPYILGSRDAALQLLDLSRENHAHVPELPDDAVVISMHDQGYAFMFIRASAGENPPVEMWTEGDETRFTVVAGSVPDWLQGVFTEDTQRHRDAERRRRQDHFRRGFEEPVCPSCRADWSAYDEVHVLPNATRPNNAAVVVCRSCGRRSHWWWGVPPRLLN